MKSSEELAVAWTLQDYFDISSFPPGSQRLFLHRCIDIRIRPLNHTVRKSEDFKLVVGIGSLALLFVGLVIVSAVTGGFGTRWLPWFFLSLPPAVVFTALLAQTVTSLTVTEFTQSEVRFSHRSLFRSKHWSESIASYQGVLPEIWKGPRRGQTWRSFTLTMYHHDESRRIILIDLPLFKEMTETMAERITADFAKALGLPILQEDKSGILRERL